MRVLLLTSVLVFGCSHTDSPVATLADPYGHVVDVNAKPWSADLAPDVKVVPIVPPVNVTRDQQVTTKNAYAFVVPRRDASEPQVEYVYFNVHGVHYRVEGLPIPHRPISNLVWATPRYLTFDRWSQPHHGMHYVVDTKRLTLVHATPFPDQFALEQQRKNSETMEVNQ